MSKVSAFNRRCESGGLRFKKKQWNRNRVFDRSCFKLIKQDGYRIEFHRLWTEKAEYKDVDDWTMEEIQGMLTRAEVLSQAESSKFTARNTISAKAFNFNRGVKYKNYPQNQKLAITEKVNNHQRQQPCFRCGKLNPVILREKYRCFCNKRAICGVN